MPMDAIEWYEMNLDYNVSGDKLNRSMSVVKTAEIIQGTSMTDGEYLRPPCSAGASSSCIQLSVSSLFAVLTRPLTTPIPLPRLRRHDEFVDRPPSPVGTMSPKSVKSSSTTRSCSRLRYITAFPQGEPLCSLIFWSLSGDDVPDREGQLITAPEDEVYLSKFSLTKHSLIMIYKTAYYSFYLPVAVAACPTILPSGNQTIKPYALPKSILIPFSEYFQIQDDFFDFFGTPEQIGNIGTDIFDNKCSWCVNTTLPVCTPKQQWVLDENYGRKDSECERRVKVVFEGPEVGFKLRKRYGVYEAKVYGSLLR
ncbi:isoprenoid synthase domain-containing protein [Armillaria nabsnona]|nr:isoprenoid synthase domain-containing protein [Armillaria nabsnona]